LSSARRQPQKNIDDGDQLLAVAAVASVNGIRQPVGEIGALERPPECLYFIAGAETAGRFPLSLRETGADVIVAPARGPRGQAVAALSTAALLWLTSPPWDLAGVLWSNDGEPSPRGDLTICAPPLERRAAYPCHRSPPAGALAVCERAGRSVNRSTCQQIAACAANTLMLRDSFIRGLAMGEPRSHNEG
jgi:selenocysteine lyase/cysteine desulfurase